ncbi:MAG: signal recognition particle protein, partial [Panacagrimonas sp.]
HPERIATRIIGQGDVLTLIEETTKKVDAEKAQKLAQKMTSKRGFDLADFREQMQQMQSMGSLESILEKLPGGAQMQAQLKNVNAEKEIRRTVAIINSMTPQERKFPDLIKASRKRRIAAGSGVEVQEVNKMLRQFETSRDLMKKVAGGGMAKMLRRLGGKLPPGMMPPR